MAGQVKKYLVFEPTKQLLDVNIEERQALADALRSGKYEQGKAVMFIKEANCYCCLGVHHSINGVSDEHLNMVPFPLHLRVVNQRSFGGLNIEHIYAANVTKLTEGGDLIHKSNIPAARFAKLNDDYGLTFEEIANLLVGEKIKRRDYV